MQPLFQILSWARENGEVRAIERIRVKVLPVTLKEMLWLDDVTEETQCSDDVLAAVRKAASDVIGQRCPY